MALRAEGDSSNLPHPGVTYFWQDAHKPPNYDWDQWVQFFEVPVLARHSFSRTELLQTVGQQHLTEAALMGNLEETPAKNIDSKERNEIDHRKRVAINSEIQADSRTKR